MADETIRLSSDPDLWTDRQGTASFTRLAFAGVDLRPYWNRLVAGIGDDANGAGIGMDLSIISQLLGDKKTGLEIQNESLRYRQLFRSPCAVAPAKLRVLGLAAPMDIGGNTPIEFLLDGSDVELITLYLVPGVPLPNPLPDHDVAVVLAPDDDKSRDTLARIERLAAHWPRPMLNRPANVLGLDRHTLCRRLSDTNGVAIPLTTRVSRAALQELSRDDTRLSKLLPDGRFPLIVRPVGSHAGMGLEKIDDAAAVAGYLENHAGESFFISRFVDYASADGLFRKYRVVLVDGKAYACHMAISEQWKIWYLNSDMLLSATNRAEESSFMSRFDEEFGRRHQAALAEISRRIGLDYCTIDCAESKEGALLIFEADNTAIVHDMDPVELFPYKAPQMRKIFDAFVAMIYRHARKERMRAA